MVANAMEAYAKKFGEAVSYTHLDVYKRQRQKQGTSHVQYVDLRV